MRGRSQKAVKCSTLIPVASDAFRAKTHAIPSAPSPPIAIERCRRTIIFCLPPTAATFFLGELMHASRYRAEKIHPPILSDR
jgi:hypothetical protein